MDSMKKEISKEEYLKYQSNPARYRSERREVIPQIWLAGYGWYGCECFESHGKYYRIDHVGSSCD